MSQLLRHAEAADAGQRDQIATVVGLAIGGDASGAADRGERGLERLVLMFGGLDHADQARCPTAPHRPAPDSAARRRSAAIARAAAAARRSAERSPASAADRRCCGSGRLMASREQDGGKLAPRVDGARIGQAPSPRTASRDACARLPRSICGRGARSPATRSARPRDRPWHRAPAQDRSAPDGRSASAVELGRAAARCRRGFGACSRSFSSASTARIASSLAPSGRTSCSVVFARSRSPLFR